MHAICTFLCLVELSTCKPIKIYVEQRSPNPHWRPHTGGLTLEAPHWRPHTGGPTQEKGGCYRDILKRPHQNIQKILKKCFLGTTHIVQLMYVNKIPPHTMLPVAKVNEKCTCIFINNKIHLKEYKKMIILKKHYIYNILQLIRERKVFHTDYYFSNVYVTS